MISYFGNQNEPERIQENVTLRIYYKALEVYCKRKEKEKGKMENRKEKGGKGKNKREKRKGTRKEGKGSAAFVIG